MSAAGFAKADGTPRTMAILLFDGVTLVDFAGPYAALNTAGDEDLRIEFVAKRPGTVRDDKGRGCAVAGRSFSEVPDPDIVLVPGGFCFEAMQDAETMAWLTAAASGAEYACGVCTGAVMLASTGLMAGRDATTIFVVKDQLAPFGARYVRSHYVEDGPFLTAAGVAAGVELGIRLVGKLAGHSMGEVIQLCLEYAPDPPYESGADWAAPAHVLAATNDFLARQIARQG